MKFYSATDKDGICQEIDRLCDTTDTTYPRLSKTSRANNALEQVVGWLIQVDGYWQFDDANYSTIPIGTGNLSSGQNSYTFNDKLLDILEVDVLDTGGIYRRITPFDPDEVGMSFEEYFNITTSTTPSGFPHYYDKWENTIRFDVAPTAANTTLTAGLKVKFKRTASLFTPASDTTADTTVPGFASPWHVILAYMASVIYCATYKKDRVPLYEKKIDALKKELVEFYSRREKDKRNIMRMKRIRYI